MSGQPHSRLFSELNDYFFVASCEPDPADVGKLKMCIAPTAEGERFFELATPESEFWFHSAEDEALKDLVFAITSRWAEATLDSPEEVANRTFEEAHGILQRLAKWWEELGVPTADTTLASEALPRAATAHVDLEEKRQQAQGAFATRARGQAGAAKTPLTPRIPGLRASAKALSPSQERGPGAGVKILSSTKKANVKVSTVSDGLGKFRPDYVFGSRSQVHRLPPLKVATHSGVDTPTTYRGRVPPPHGISGFPDPSTLLRQRSRRAHALTRDVHRAPRRPALSYPIPAPIGHDPIPASRARIQRRASLAKSDEERATVLQARREKAASKKKAIEDRRSESAGNSDEGNAIIPRDRREEAARNQRWDATWDTDEDQPLLQVRAARKERAAQTQHRESSESSDEDRAIILLASEEAARKRQAMDSQVQNGAQPDFRVLARSLPRSKKDADPAGESLMKQQATPQQRATSAQDQAVNENSVEDTPMLDAPMDDAPVDSQPVAVTQPTADDDITMEDEAQTSTQGPAVAVPTQPQETPVAADNDMHMEDANPGPYNIDTYARFPSDPPGTNPVADFPTHNVAHPPANFRDIQYPGLPEAIHPFSRDQTAHLRAIIPAHVRQAVETQPALPLLARAGATVQRGRPQPDWEVGYQVFLEYYLADLVFPSAAGGPRRPRLTKEHIKAMVRVDPRIQPLATVHNATQQQWNGRIHSRSLALDADKERSFRCLVFRHFPPDPVAVSRSKRVARTDPRPPHEQPDN